MKKSTPGQHPKSNNNSQNIFNDSGITYKEIDQAFFKQHPDRWAYVRVATTAECFEYSMLTRQPFTNDLIALVAQNPDNPKERARRLIPATNKHRLPKPEHPNNRKMAQNLCEDWVFGDQPGVLRK